MATPWRAAAAELSGPAGAGQRDGGERGSGVDGLGDGGAGARGRGAGARGRRRVWSPVLGDGAGAVDGAGDWGLAAPCLRFGAVEWRLRFGARASEKKTENRGSTVGSSPHPAVLTGGVDDQHRRAYPQPGGVECLYRRVYSQPGGVEPLQATTISFTCLLHSRQSGGIYVYFIQDKVEANMAVIHSRQICLLRMYRIVLIRHIFNKFYTIRSGGI